MEHAFEKYASFKKKILWSYERNNKSVSSNLSKYM